MTPERTEEQIVMEANSLARDFYALMGYEVPEGYRFDKAGHPQELLCWAMAARAFDVLQHTDIEDAASALDD
jgi:hypothetical protein